MTHRRFFGGPILQIGRLSLCFASLLLAACASDRPSSEIAAAVAGGLEPALHPDAVRPLVTKLDAMQSALPSFAFLPPAGNEVSVDRSFGFTTQSPIVSSNDVRRIALLQAYLLTDPLLKVRVEGYFDAVADRALALDRAQALVRALLTNMRIENEMSAVAVPRGASDAEQAAIIFVDANDLGQMQTPLRNRASGAAE